LLGSRGQEFLYISLKYYNRRGKNVGKWRFKKRSNSLIYPLKMVRIVKKIYELKKRTL
jgi:hypothetical protein